MTYFNNDLICIVKTAKISCKIVGMLRDIYVASLIIVILWKIIKEANNAWTIMAVLLINERLIENMDLLDK